MDVACKRNKPLNHQSSEGLIAGYERYQKTRRNGFGYQIVVPQYCVCRVTITKEEKDLQDMSQGFNNRNSHKINVVILRISFTSLQPADIFVKKFQNQAINLPSM